MKDKSKAKEFFEGLGMTLSVIWMSLILICEEIKGRNPNLSQTPLNGSLMSKEQFRSPNFNCSNCSIADF